jgi:hypothetical protein
MGDRIYVGAGFPRPDSHSDVRLENDRAETTGLNNAGRKRHEPNRGAETAPLRGISSLRHSSSAPAGRHRFVSVVYQCGKRTLQLTFLSNPIKCRIKGERKCLKFYASKGMCFSFTAMKTANRCTFTCAERVDFPSFG